mgnify:CR=1 FL=1
MMTAPEFVDPRKISGIIEVGKMLANRYREYTGKPLGITGEVGEFEAANLLNLTLVGARTPGYDAKDDRGKRYQIKTRVVLPTSKPGQRLGSIKLDKQWEYVLLVLLDEHLDPVEIHQATRRSVAAALKEPGSKARNQRGALGVNKFKRIGRCVWRREPSPVGA